jgi:hypothetical protein
MSKVYLPTAEQMDTTLYNLSRIAGALGDNADVSTWAGIERAVKSGIASQLFPIGSQFTVSHSVYGDMLFDVVAHDYFKSVDNENAHTMTLLCHDIIESMQYDSAEAFHYAENELKAGTYNFTHDSFGNWSAGTYQFTLTQTVPVGGQLCFNTNAAGSAETRQVVVYASRTTTTPTETVAITSGSGGTSLGTFGIELNHIHRVSYGSNNYKESAIRQFLNSSAESGKVWTPQTKFDRPPEWMGSMTGFMNGLGEDFISIIGKVVIPCVGNDTYESPDSSVSKNGIYTITDKIYLASQKEIIGDTEGTLEDTSSQFAFYKGATKTDFIKYKGVTALNWWTRSSSNTGVDRVRLITTEGSSRYYGASNLVGVVPCVTII